MGHSPPEIFQFLSRSDNRVTVLTALTTDAAATRSTLQRQTGIPRSTVSRILHELEDRELVSRAAHRYEVTPFGRSLATRLRSVFDSIEAMQRLQTLLDKLSDTEPELAFTDYNNSEVLTPISTDPGAPTRRFADLLHAASCIRLLSPAAIPMLVDVNSVLGDGVQTVDVVIPRAELAVVQDASLSSQQLRDVVASGDVTLFAHDGDIPYFAGVIDGIAVIGLIDDVGSIQGYIETHDETVRSWTEATFEAYQRTAVHVDTEDLTA